MKRITLSVFLALSATTTIAGTMGEVIQSQSGNYLGVFGGGGTLSRLSVAQLGTAYYSELLGGPLAVNAFGHTQARSEWLVGAHAGYFFSDHALPYFTQWSIIPAAEVEGYYIGKNTLSVNDVNNSTIRLDEHIFAASYPMKSGVGLVNALINLGHPSYMRWHPYVAGGVGAAVISINNATSAQLSPFEPGVNHYNSDPSASSTVFASQAKTGLNFDLTDHLGVFAEYRYIYLSASDFEFGSTNYPTHVATSSWNAKLGSQSYNMGVAGLRYIV